MLSKEVSSTIFKVFGMTRPGIEPRSPGPLANTLPTWPMSQLRWHNLQEIYQTDFNQFDISWIYYSVITLKDLLKIQEF